MPVRVQCSIYSCQYFFSYFQFVRKRQNTRHSDETIFGHNWVTPGNTKGALQEDTSFITKSHTLIRYKTKGIRHRWWLVLGAHQLLCQTGLCGRHGVSLLLKSQNPITRWYSTLTTYCFDCFNRFLPSEVIVTLSLPCNLPEIRHPEQDGNYFMKIPQSLSPIENRHNSKPFICIILSITLKMFIKFPISQSLWFKFLFCSINVVTPYKVPFKKEKAIMIRILIGAGHRTNFRIEYYIT